ncbi:NUDIX hydrolase [Candidatus Parcubacteria bacterium]|nr:MAG: NUDIX hydrolase [Candidatus Parcubacteria bacterium]
MSWQDVLLSIGQFVFAAALLPSVFGKDKPALFTSLTTGIVLGVFAFTYLTLQLWSASIFAAVVGVLWLILAFQKYFGKEKSANNNHLIADIPQRALIENDGKFLLVQEFNGQWQLPGGRLNVGEKLEDGLKREIKEELGIDIEVGIPLSSFVFTGKSGINHFTVIYQCDFPDKKQEIILDKNENMDYRWVAVEELNSMNTYTEHKEAILSFFKKRE